MIRILNYFLGILFQYLLLVVIKIFPHLRVQLGIIVNRITEVNRLGQGFSEYLIDSLILIEDKRHFQHFGVDFYSMLRAIFNNIWSNRREGASTITQQLVRCVTGEREISIKRKIREIIFSILVNDEFSKRQILTAYLNLYQFNGCVGVREFCEMEDYDLSTLSLNESAQVAARFKYPSINELNYLKYLKRVRLIEIKATKKKIYHRIYYNRKTNKAKKIDKFKNTISQLVKSV